MPTARLRIDGLVSAADERHLETRVRGLAGVYGVVASCRDRCMEVDFEDDEVKVGDIVDEAGAAGFEARPAS
jgi:hypothetical protein